MEKIDNTQADAVMHEHEDEELVMEHVVQDDPELMYLHVCLSEILCRPEESV
ncbi:MAG: hypothetical protein LUF87_11415 [Alistipes sp.]|nr:hypothetical protein [Alistipes sp.]